MHLSTVFKFMLLLTRYTDVGLSGDVTVGEKRRQARFAVDVDQHHAVERQLALFRCRKLRFVTRARNIYTKNFNFNVKYK